MTLSTQNVSLLGDGVRNCKKKNAVGCTNALKVFLTLLLSHFAMQEMLNVIFSSDNGKFMLQLTSLYKRDLLPNHHAE